MYVMPLRCSLPCVRQNVGSGRLQKMWPHMKDVACPPACCLSSYMKTRYQPIVSSKGTALSQRQPDPVTDSMVNKDSTVEPEEQGE